MSYGDDDLARLARAFSLRRNLGLLFTPLPGRLGPIDGLRALSMLWVVLFHAGWYMGERIPLETYAALVFSPRMLFLWRGDFGVDVFFVLSGFLIAGMLADERAETGEVRLGLFYVRRLFRLWPALAAAVAADVVLIGDHPDMVWANLLYVSNFVPILHGAMGWTWSLAIEEQFYLVCPWLVAALTPLGGRARLLTIAAIALALVGVGAWVVVGGGFTPVDSEVVVNRDWLVWARGYDHLYAKPWMRAGPLLAGVGAAYVHRLPGAMEAFGRQRLLAAAGFALALAAAVVATHWPIFTGQSRAVEVTYLAAYRTVFGVAVAYVLLFSLSPHPIGKALGRALSTRVLHPFAQLAYAAYLVNPIATMRVDRALAPLVVAGKADPLPLFLPFDFLATFAAALALHLLVERPLMELRPRR